MPDDEHAPGARRFLGTTRMEAFSDGVFAIAITLLVLELAIPPSGTALERVLDAWPSYLAYVVSFLTIAAAWLAHTALTDRLTRVDLPLLRLNLVLLLLVAALPFPTRLVADGIHDVSDERVFVTMYGVALAGIRILLYAVDAYARREHLGPPEAAGEPAGDRRSIVTVVLVYGAALLVGLVAPGLAVGAYCAIAVFLVVPFGELRRLLFRRPSLPRIESRGRAPRGDGRASG